MEMAGGGQVTARNLQTAFAKQREHLAPVRLNGGEARRLWDAPFLLRNYYQNNDFGPPAVQVPPDGFPASADRVGRSFVVCFEILVANVVAVAKI